MQKGLKIGQNVSISDNVFLDPSHCFLISIGDNCIISNDVRIFAHDASSKIFLDYTRIAPVTIHRNCFLGAGSIIMPGVMIGPNSIIGAGSVVTKSVPSYSVYAGNPAKLISSVGDYLEKIRALSKDKTIFSKDYDIENLDEGKRAEIIKSIGDTVGFIV